MSNTIEAKIVMVDNKDGTPVFKNFQSVIKGSFQKYYIPDCQYRLEGKTISLRMKNKKPKTINGLPY